MRSHLLTSALLCISMLQCNNYSLADKLANPGVGNSTSQERLIAFVASSASLASFSGYIAGMFAGCSGFTGQGRADCACQVMATNAGLAMPKSGKYIAWNSTSTNDMRCRIQGIFNSATCSSIPSNGPLWVNTNGQAIANGYAGLFSGNLMAPLNLTETKGAPPSTDVWTGTIADGTLGGTGATSACTDWTSAGNGIAGTTTSSGGTWTNNGTASSCSSSSLPIYCFAQP